MHAISYFYCVLKELTSFLKLRDLTYNKDKLPKWTFFLGVNAFSASFHMLAPDFDTGNSEQSSNAMHIECAFGMLVNKWAMLCHQLDVKFSRRVPLINACFHLNNFCFDQKMFKENVSKNQDKHVKIQPSYGSISAAWAKNPSVDKIGRLVDYLNWIRSTEKIPLTKKDNKHYNRDNFKKRIESRFLSRPKK